MQEALLRAKEQDRNITKREFCLTSLIGVLKFEIQRPTTEDIKREYDAIEDPKNCSGADEVEGFKEG